MPDPNALKAAMDAAVAKRVEQRIKATERGAKRAQRLLANVGVGGVTVARTSGGVRVTYPKDYAVTVHSAIAAEQRRLG